MSLAGLFDAAHRWLPYPVYRFEGGPADGKELEVLIVETEAGMIPPPLFDIAEHLPLGPGDDPASAMIKRHTYRFVPIRGSINCGHYEWVPQP